MQYRELGLTGLKVSALGFGCMRFLSRRGRETWGRSIDASAALSLLHEAFDLGVNYFDTAWNYHGGASEVLLSRFLREVPRDRVLVATKNPVWKARRPGDFRRLFNVQLKRLASDSTDLYLLHSLNEAGFARARELGVLDFLDRERREGRIRHAGFSFHDKPSSFAPIVDAWDWDFCQIQYNIVDTEEQAGRAGLEYAAGRGLGVVVMEPLRGGDLVRRLPPVIEEAWGSLPGRTPAELCLRWVWNHPGVSLVLSGMNSGEQLRENARIARSALPESMGGEEMEAVGRVQEAYRGLQGVHCTRCGYCLPCPAGVQIPRIFEIYNEACMFPSSAIPGMAYNSWMKPENRADACTGCGSCEEKCTQGIRIRAGLAEAHSRLCAPKDGS